MAMVRKVGGGGTNVGTASYMMVAVEAQGWIEAAGDSRVGCSIRGCRGTSTFSSQWRSGVRSYMGENQKRETIGYRIIYGTAGIYIGSAHVDARKVRLLLYERLLLRAAKSRSILDPWCVVARAHS